MGLHGCCIYYNMITQRMISAVCLRGQDLARELQRPMRVVGWYHSHPHITVWPSHVGKILDTIIIIIN